MWNRLKWVVGSARWGGGEGGGGILVLRLAPEGRQYVLATTLETDGELGDSSDTRRAYRDPETSPEK
jgi:hypothetical protein